MLAAACALHGGALTAPINLPCHNRIGASIGTYATSVQPRDTAELLDRWAPFAGEASRRFGIPKNWIRKVIQVESGGRITLHDRPIASPAGAMGLMQLMPKTYEDMRRKYGLGPDPFAPRDNILAGAAYLHEMFDRFGDGFLAAYNAGPGRYRSFLEGKEPLPSETIFYLAKLHPTAAGIVFTPGRSSSAPPPNTLFVALSSGDTDAVRRPSRAMHAAIPRPEANAIFAMNARSATGKSDSRQKELFVALSSADR